MKNPGTTELPAIARLLAENGLPTDDLDEQDLSLFLVQGTGEELHAVGGLERCGETALIRSVATSDSMRRQGIGRRMVAELERLAAKSGIQELYLLTETAEGYFESLHYATVERTEVPRSIRESRQFSALCPDSATVMRKRLDAGSDA